MSEQTPHPEALENFERAHIPDAKIHHALRHPDKGRVFAALGFSEEAENWKSLRDAIYQALPRHLATYNKQNEHGTYYEVVLPIRGPAGKEAPVKTVWIYRWGEDFPRLVTSYIIVREWTRWEQGKGDTTTADG